MLIFLQKILRQFAGREREVVSRDESLDHPFLKAGLCQSSYLTLLRPRVAVGKYLRFYHSTRYLTHSNSRYSSSSGDNKSCIIGDKTRNAVIRKR